MRTAVESIGGDRRIVLSKAVPTRKNAVNGNGNRVQAGSYSRGDTISRGKGPGGSAQSTYIAPGYDITNGILDGSISSASLDMKVVQDLYLDMYYNDHVSGSAVDLRATLPWSDFNLQGAKEETLRVYMETIERLNMKHMHTSISTDYLVSGAFLSFLVYERSKAENGFTDVMPFMFRDAEIQETPMYNMDPIIRVTVPEEYKKFVNSKEEAFVEAQEMMPQDTLEILRKADVLDLDPITTLYVPRRSFTTNKMGISYLQRVVPAYLIERTLFKGTFAEFNRRQRATLHITAGNEDWLPTEEELSEIAGLFQTTEADPVSNVIATREFIQTSEIQCLHGSTKVCTSKCEMEIREIYGPKSRDEIEGTERLLDNVHARGVDGKYRPVESCIYKGRKPTVGLKLSSGEFIRCTENHKHLTVGKDLDLVPIETKVFMQHLDSYNSETTPFVVNDPAREDVGVPMKLLLEAVSLRRLMRSNERFSAGIYLNDSGNEVLLPQLEGYIKTQMTLFSDNNLMTYEGLQEGRYTDMLNAVRGVSERLYSNVVKLIKMQVSFPYLIMYSRGEDADVYDLHMKEENGPPVFCIAGGIVTMNSGGDFFKWTDILQELNAVKYQALGITEAFLGGEQSIQNMETAMSVFVESLRSNRENLTHQIYYKKLFPLISNLNGFTADQKESTGKDDNKVTSAAKSTTERMTNLQFKLNDTENLLIPRINWHKPLRPEADREYLDMLDLMNEKGVPITLSMWAAAGGISLEQLIRDLPDDKQIRDEIKSLVPPPPADEGGGGFGFASVMDKAGVKPIAKESNLLTRDYAEEDREVYGRTRTGKKKHIPDQQGERKKIRDKGMKALENISDPNEFRNALSRKAALTKGGSRYWSS